MASTGTGQLARPSGAVRFRSQRYDRNIMNAAAAGPSRSDRQKARTRAALIEAAQALFASGEGADVSIQDITEAADVGFGSFYNHFGSKSELFNEAIDATFEEHGAWLDDLLRDEEDPAVVFAMSMRLTGRLLATKPQIAKVMMKAAGRLLRSDVGIAPRALRDIKAAVAAGRFRVEDPEVALACAAGALIGVLHLGARSPGQDHGTVTDEMTHYVLRMLGMSEDEAARTLLLPLPTRG